MEWSKYQKDVFANIASGEGHTVVNAVAGSGKTTTIVRSLEHVPHGAKTLFVAFNKKIAENLKSVAPPGIEVSTLHSYGLKTVSASLGRLTIDNDRVIKRFARDLYGDPWDLRYVLSKVVSLAKGTLAKDVTDIDELIDAFGIDIPKPKTLPVNDANQEGEEPPKSERELAQERRALMAMTNREAFCKDVFDTMLRCAKPLEEDGCMDFDDMIWLPLILDLPQRRFDRVFVDERQDLNAAQIKMVMRSVKPGHGRICAVGDTRQAIYGFRGADSGAMDKLIQELGATVLPLSVCYRCARNIVKEAQKIVPEIEPAPDAEDGVVRDVTETQMIDNAKAGDFILSRTNAPLISYCMMFLREGIPANIQGRDVGAALAAFVKKSNSPDVISLRNYVEEWRDAECERLAKKHRDTQAVEDRADCVLALSDGANSVAEVVARIQSLFADKDDYKRIILSTTHKAKGLERDRVWVLTSTYMRRPGIEEKNLYYVAVTRAKKELYLVKEDEEQEENGYFDGR